MDDSTSRYITLQDFARLLREQMIVIVVVTVACAGVAIGVASGLPTKYQADAQLQVQDTSQALGLVGTPIPAVQTAAELAAQGASTLVTVQLLTSVKRTLGLSQSVTQLGAMVSVQADSTSNLLHLHVTAPQAQLSANLANALARTASAERRQQARAQYATAAARLKARYRASNPTNDPASRAIFDERLSELEAVASVVNPLEVASLASVPSSPSSPKPVQDGVIGGILGVLLGLLIAVLRNAFDRRLRSPTEIRHEIDLPLLGHVRNTALGYAGDVPRGKRQLAGIDVEAFRMMRTNAEFLFTNGGRPLRTFAVTSAASEEGKSTTAAALAFAYAASGRRTLLLECDLRRPCLAERLQLPPAPGLTDCLRGRATFDQVVYEAQTRNQNQGSPDPRAASVSIEPNYEPGQNGQAIEAFGGLPDVVVAGSPIRHPAEVLGSPRLADFLDQTKTRYEIVILDTPPLLAVADTLEILSQADGLIVCVRARQTTRPQLAAARDTLGRLPSRPAGLVVTGINKRDDDYSGYYGYYG